MRSEWIDKESTAMGSRIVTFTEFCGDLARSLASVVKVPALRLCRIPDHKVDVREQWLALVEDIVNTTMEMLSACRIIGKDTTSALATVLVTFCRLCGKVSDGPYQVLYFVSLLVANESVYEVLSSFGISHQCSHTSDYTGV